MTRDRVLVSGCFDLLHSGHIEFLQQASRFGRLTVAIGSDATICSLKGRPPIYGATERAYMLKALRCVDEVVVSPGAGLLDFEPVLRLHHPDHFVVNADGDQISKSELCEELGIQYHVLERAAPLGLPPRSSTIQRRQSRIPFRIDLAGGWLDQPFVSKMHPGSVVVLNLEPMETYALCSGLATSTRTVAERLWGLEIPRGNLLELARILFACENPPGSREIAGSQDALGIVLPGVNRLDYAGGYWPAHIELCDNLETSAWLESKLYLRFIGPRAVTLNVLEDTAISPPSAKRLADAADACWRAIGVRDSRALGGSIREGFLAQLSMFPRMTNALVSAAISALPHHCHGFKLAGAGGGGYLIVVADNCPEGFEPICVRNSLGIGAGEPTLW